MRKSLTIRRVIGVVGTATLLVAGGLAYADITPPPPFTGCDFLTGGGFIFPSHSKGTFAVGGGCRHGSGIAGVPYWGHLEYHDHGLDLNVHWNDITAYFPEGTTGTDPQTGMLRRFALRQTESMRFIITGGADRLPRAFATTLAPRIRYQSPVVRIEPGETCAGVVVGREGQRQRITADHIICTLPFSVLKRVDVSPSFSAHKALAVEQLPYTSSTRVYLQFRRRAWTSERRWVSAATDLPVKWVFEHTVSQPGPRGILEALATGVDGRRVARMPEADRLQFALAQLEQIFPGLAADFERGVSKSWDEDPWARGAFAYFRPGQMQALLPHIVAPEGRVHFAGEHTSPWSGWMEGALESGLRAAREVDQAG